MDIDLQHTLLQLFQQVSDHPDDMPEVPVENWREGSVEWQLLTGFRHVLERLQQNRQQAEAQLREKEAQYRNIFEATSDALLIVDLEEGRVAEVNPTACRLFGYSYEEFLDLPSTALIPPDHLPLRAEGRQTIRAGHQFQAQGVALRKDGSLLHIEAHITPFIYKGKPHLLSVDRDITERVRAEEQLREKEAQYRSIFETTTDALYIFDLESGLLVEANPAACRLHGFSYEEFLALPPTSLISPNMRPAFDRFLLAMKVSSFFQEQSVSAHRDGSVFPIEVRGTPIMYKGKLHGLAVARDITEQVQAYELLEQRVEERTRELATLLEVSHNVASTIELKPLLGLVLDQLEVVADYTGSSFSIVEGEELVLVDNRGPAPLEQALQVHLSLKRMGPIWEKFSRQEPVIIPDVQDKTPPGSGCPRVVGRTPGNDL